MPNIIYDTHLDDIEAINITTDVYLKSEYSYPDVEDQIYHKIEGTKKQNSKIGTLETNYNNRTTDYDEQNFIFDENTILQRSQKTKKKS